MEVDRTRFLAHIAKVYGESMEKECARVLDEQGDADFSPVRVLNQAHQRLYRDQLEAAAAADGRCFDSDGDL